MSDWLVTTVSCTPMVSLLNTAVVVVLSILLGRNTWLGVRVWETRKVSAVSAGCLFETKAHLFKVCLMDYILVNICQVLFPERKPYLPDNLCTGDLCFRKTFCTTTNMTSYVNGNAKQKHFFGKMLYSYKNNK